MPVTPGMLMAKRKRKTLSAGSAKKRQKTSYSNPAISTANLITPRTGFGTRKYCKMIYAEKGLSLTTGVIGASTDYIFRLNDIFDPNFTGTGHQPSMHDQMNAVFERYCVTGCAYKVSFSNSSTSNRQLVAVYISDRDTTVTDITTIIEQGSVQYRQLSVSTAGGSQATISGYVDLPQLMGMTKDAYTADSNYATEFGNDPSDPGFLHCVAADIGSGGSTVITLMVELVFDVLLLGTRLIPQS